jgi:hypothetical protein
VIQQIGQVITQFAQAFGGPTRSRPAEGELSELLEEEIDLDVESTRDCATTSDQSSDAEPGSESLQGEGRSAAPEEVVRTSGERATPSLLEWIEQAGLIENSAEWTNEAFIENPNLAA